MLGERRGLLARAARALDMAGRRVDLVSYNHPVASILRGCSRSLRGFLGRTESLSGDYPRQVAALLNNIVVVLAGPADQRVHAEVGQVVDAFDSAGAPDPALRVGTTGRWSSIAARTVDVLDRFARLGATVWGLFTLVVVVILLLTGTLDLSKIQLQK